MEQGRLQMIEEMLQKNPTDSFLQYAAALEYEKHGELQKSIDTIEAMLKLDPEYLGAYYKLGKLYEQINQVDTAIDVYKRGKQIAKKQNDRKTTGELTEALMILDADDDEFDW
ncbi:MAG: hypothetical protein ACFB10_06585 [Salibacteraceae bacterium]